MHFGQLTLEEADICFETVGGSHLDRKEVVVVLLELLVGGVLRQEQLGEIIEVVDRSWRKRVEPIESYSLLTGGKDPPQDGVASGIDHHLVLILAEMLDQIALIRVTFKGWTQTNSILACRDIGRKRTPRSSSEYDRADPSCGDVMNSTRRIVPME